MAARIPPLPSVTEYKRALNRLRGSLHENHRLLLKHHYRSHKRTSTATHLAKFVKYASYRAVNLQYGKLGLKLSKALGSSYRPPRGAQASHAIASFVPPSPDHSDWEWTMHGPLAEALRELKWPLN